MRSFLNKSILGAVAIAALGLIAAPKANANITLALAGAPTAVSGGFRYDYTVTLTAGFTISPGTVPTGLGGNSLPQGTTLFDFFGLVDAPGNFGFNPIAAGASFAVTTPSTGTQNPAFPETPFDNIDAIYNGATITATPVAQGGAGNIILGTLFAVSSTNVVNTGVNPYASTTENTETTFASTNQSQADGPGTVAVPEANAGLLAGLALPLLGGIAILRRKKN